MRDGFIWDWFGLVIFELECVGGFIIRLECRWNYYWGIKHREEGIYPPHTIKEMDKRMDTQR